MADVEKQACRGRWRLLYLYRDGRMLHPAGDVRVLAIQADQILGEKRLNIVRNNGLYARYRQRLPTAS